MNESFANLKIALKANSDVVTGIIYRVALQVMRVKRVIRRPHITDKRTRWTELSDRNTKNFCSNPKLRLYLAD